jgi:hypothetical protein
MVQILFVLLQKMNVHQRQWETRERVFYQSMCKAIESCATIQINGQKAHVHVKLAYLKCQAARRVVGFQFVRFQLCLNVTQKGINVALVSNPRALQGCLVVDKLKRLSLGICIVSPESRRFPLKFFVFNRLNQLSK